MGVFFLVFIILYFSIPVYTILYYTQGKTKQREDAQKAQTLRLWAFVA